MYYLCIIRYGMLADIYIYIYVNFNSSIDIVEGIKNQKEIIKMLKCRAAVYSFRTQLQTRGGLREKSV